MSVCIEWMKKFVFDEDIPAWYQSRPQRTGKWFVAHKTVIDEIKDDIESAEEPINIWDSFFCKHPVGDGYSKEFFAISLNEIDIQKYYERIRIASYRWEDIKGVGEDGSEYHAPSNYLWFLKFLEKERVLGWMDFMANIVVNCPGGETVAYMGSLYAQYMIISHWMIDPPRLGAALERGWIFQETAFGAFDSSAISHLLDEMRNLALLSLPSNQKQSKESRIQSFMTFIRIAEHLSKLLDRRGYYAMAQITPLLSDRQYDYYHQIGFYGMTGNVTKRAIDRVLGNDEEFDNEFYSLVNQHVEQGYKNGYTAMFHICDLFTDTDEENFDAVYKAIFNLLTTKSWCQASTVKQLFEKIGDPLLAAFSALEVTYETDRNNALTQVAKAIIEEDFKLEQTHEQFCQNVWIGAADICLQTRGMIGTTVIKFQPTIPEGNLFIGGVSVSGALLDGNGFYKTQNGDSYQCDWALRCVTSYSTKFEWSESEYLWMKVDDENEKDRYEIFLCKPPDGNNFFSGYVARLVGGSPSYAQFFTSQSQPYFPEPACEATFC